MEILKLCKHITSALQKIQKFWEQFLQTTLSIIPKLTCLSNFQLNRGVYKIYFLKALKNHPKGTEKSL